MKPTARIAALVSAAAITAITNAQTPSQRIVQALGSPGGTGARSLMSEALGRGMHLRFTKGIPAEKINQITWAGFGFYPGSAMPPLNDNGQAMWKNEVKPHFFINEASAVNANQLLVYLVIPGGKNARNEFCTNTLIRYTVNVDNNFANLITSNSPTPERIITARTRGASYNFTAHDGGTGNPYPIINGNTLLRPMNMDDTLTMLIDRHHCMGGVRGAKPSGMEVGPLFRPYGINWNADVRNSNEKVAAGIDHADKFFAKMPAPYGAMFDALADISLTENPPGGNGKYFKLNRPSGDGGDLSNFYGTYGWGVDIGGRRPVCAVSFSFPGEDWGVTGGPRFRVEADTMNLKLATKGALYPVTRDGAVYGKAQVYRPGSFWRVVPNGEGNLWNYPVADQFEDQVNAYLGGGFMSLRKQNTLNRLIAKKQQAGAALAM